jgi:S-formylglutathione hydrolase
MHGAWTRLDVAGKPADVYDLAAGSRPRFGVLYLHGASLETLTGRPVFAQLLDELRLACVCPHGNFSWWCDRVWAGFDPNVTAEQHVLRSVVPFVQERWSLAPPAIGLLGYSMGGQGALRLAFKQPEMFPAVAAFASAVDYHERYDAGLATGSGGAPASPAAVAVSQMYDSKEQCRQDTALMHIHPSHYPPHVFFCIDPNDRDWYRGNDRLHEKLNALGVPHEADLETRAGGHSWDYVDHMAGRALRFLVSGLEQQSRRLL